MDQHNCLGKYVQCFTTTVELHLIQILMNVPRMDMDVTICVLTLKDHTHVAAERSML